MKISFRLASYYAEELTPDEARTLRETEGWIALKNGNFRTSNVMRVLPFVEYCVDQAKIRAEALIEKRTAAVAPSAAVTTSMEIPAPDNLTYRPYQAAGIAFMRARNISLNGDVPRLGKTIQTLGVINTYGRVLKVLVVGPANAKTNWCREARKWLIHQSAIDYAEGDVLPAAEFTVINYELLSRHADALRGAAWDVVVYDEAHALKNHQSKRTEICLGTQRQRGLFGSLHTIFLTGTPIFVKPIDFWNIIRLGDPLDLGRSWYSFVHRYCDAQKNGFALDVSGRSHEEELQFKLRSSFMVRREKKDIGHELKPTRQTVYLPKTGLTKILKAEKNAFEQNLDTLYSLLQEQPTPDVVKQAMAALEEMEANFPAPVATVRRDLGLAKVKMAVDVIEETLLAEPKVVIFAHHVDVIRELSTAFPDFAVIVGGMTSKQRDAERERFQSNPACRGIIGNITAMGVAIELSAADTCIFVEQSWIPAEMDQAEERIWLPTKTMPMTIIKLVVEDSLEVALNAIVEMRQASIDRTLNIRHLPGVAI